MVAKYYVYRNLHTGTFSLKYRGKVVSHPTNIFLKDVSFNVSEKGRQRVITSRRKNVHATIAGFPYTPERRFVILDEIHYNPYTTSQFCNAITNEPIYTTPYIMCRYNKIFLVKDYDETKD